MSAVDHDDESSIWWEASETEGNLLAGISDQEIWAIGDCYTDLRVDILAGAYTALREEMKLFLAARAVGLG